MGAGRCQVRGIGPIMRHWLLVFVAYTFVRTLFQDGCQGRRRKKNYAFRQALMALRDCATTSGFSS